ncbi:MAG TPA: T9SS type A sorting domain-containing protein, partial [Bacteroidia bacterium]|nr:T9SS type A sorting domain-containing protein [Bacteroidia bacterium]
SLTTYYYEDNGIASDPTGKYIYLAGTMDNDILIFGADTLSVPNGGGDPYIARWLPCGSQNNEGMDNLQANNLRVVLYPNPNNGKFAIEVKSEVPIATGIRVNSIVEVYNMLGEKIYSSPFTIYNSPFAIDLSSQSNGIYLYRVLNESGNLAGEGKFVISK